jgi:hypothetical protein
MMKVVSCPGQLSIFKFQSFDLDPVWCRNIVFGLGMNPKRRNKQQQKQVVFQILRLVWL